VTFQVSDFQSHESRCNYAFTTL